MRCVSGLLLAAFALPAGAEKMACRQDFTPAGGSYPFTEREEAQPALPEAARVGQVHITNLEVFDESNPRENNAVYRFLNRIHIKTRPDLIRSQLLFAEGDAYNARLIDESARLLRAHRYLNDADIRPVSVCEDRVDVEVVTRDVWSLSADVSFDRSGGENNFGLGVRDTNLLGRGTELSVRTSQDIDRDSNEFTYKSNNLRGGRLKSRLRYLDNDDGSEALALLELPFFSLDSRRAWVLSARNIEQIDAQYLRGDDVTEVVHDMVDYRIGYGFSRGLVDGVARRWTLGYRYRSSEFRRNDDELPPPAIFPTDRTLSFPYLEYASVEDKYERGVNINQFGRTEDLHTGRSFHARLGYSAESFGADEDRLVFEGRYRDMLYYSGRHLLEHEFEFSGLRNQGTGKVEDLMLDYSLRYVLSASRYRSYLADFRAIYAKNLNSNLQVVLGGHNGLRGFDNRLQVGDRSLVLNLERRTFTDIHLFNLVRVGWAFFIDVGRAWDPDVDADFEDKYLANAGFGLRLASSKSNVGRFMHIDLAFPLTNRDDPDVDSSLVSVRVTNRF